VLVLPTLTASSHGGSGGGGQGNSIVLVAPERVVAFSGPSDVELFDGWQGLLGPDADDVLAGFPGTVDVELRSSAGVLMRLPAVDVVEPHSGEDLWSSPSGVHRFVTGRDRANEIIRGLQIDLAPSSGACAAIGITVEQHGTGNVKSTVSATIERCEAGATFEAPSFPVPVVPVGTVVIGGGATPHAGFRLDVIPGSVCAVKDLEASTGHEVLEPFSAVLELKGIGGDCTVRVRYLDDEGGPFGPEQSMTIAVGDLALVPNGSDGDLSDGDLGEAIAGYAVTDAPAVKVLDEGGGPVEGAAVTFEVASGGGWLEGVKEVTTGADGVATAGSWTLGSVGKNTLTVTAGGGSITLTATGTPNLILSTPEAPNQLETSLPISGFALRDGFTLELTTGTPEVCAIRVGSVSMLDSDGLLAPFSAVIELTGRSGSCVVRAAYAGAEAPFGPVTTSFSVEPIVLEPVAGDRQDVVAGTTAPVAPAVLVTDASNRPVPGVTVEFSVVQGGGSLTSTTSTSDGDGIATAGAWTLGIDPGDNVVEAVVAIAGDEPVSITFTVRGKENLVLDPLRDRTQSDTFVTVRGQALSATWATITVSTSPDSAQVCSSVGGSLRVSDEGLLVPFSAVVSLTGAAGDCEVEVAYGTSDGTGSLVRRVSFKVQAEAVEALPPPAPSDAPVEIDGIELSADVVIESTMTIDPDRAGRANIRAQVTSYVNADSDGSGEGSGDGGRTDGEVLDSVDVWISAPMTPAGNALLVDGDAELAIEGDGYEPGSAVAIYLYSEPTFVGMATVDENGAFVGSFVVPDGLARDASHTLRIVGFSTLGHCWVVAAPVYLTGAALVTPPTTPLVTADVGPDTATVETVDTAAVEPVELGSIVGPPTVVVGAADLPAPTGRRSVGAATAPETEGGADRQGPLPSDADLVTGCEVGAVDASASLAGWLRVAGRGPAPIAGSSVLSLTGWSLFGSGCAGTIPLMVGWLGLAGLFVAVLLSFAWRRRATVLQSPAARVH
jgi:hypothetical protein